MTQRLIYGKTIELQADSIGLRAPTTVTGGLTTDSLVSPIINTNTVNTSIINVTNTAIVENLDLTSSISFPLTSPNTQPRLTVNDSGGAIFAPNPATGAPFIIPASALQFRFYMGLSQTSGTGVSFYQGAFGPGGASFTGTITAPGVGASLLVPGWIPLGARPLVQQRIPIHAAVGPVAQPTTLIFQMETNGDVRIFKDSISTNWNNNDTFTINTVTPFIIAAPFPLL